MTTKLLLSDPGEFVLVGPEKGQKVSDGISRYVSPHGSYRYVMYVSGVPVSALQIMSKDRGKTGQISNVYTAPEFRRKGYAAQLLAHARREFQSIVHAPEAYRSQAGMAWSQSVRSGSMSLFSQVTKLAYENPNLRGELLPLLKAAKEESELAGLKNNEIVQKWEDLRKSIQKKKRSLDKAEDQDALKKEIDDLQGEFDKYEEERQQRDPKRKTDARLKKMRGMEKEVESARKMRDYSENYDGYVKSYNKAYRTNISRILERVETNAVKNPKKWTPLVDFLKERKEKGVTEHADPPKGNWGSAFNREWIVDVDWKMNKFNDVRRGKERYDKEKDQLEEKIKEYEDLQKEHEEEKEGKLQARRDARKAKKQFTNQVNSLVRQIETRKKNLSALESDPDADPEMIKSMADQMKELEDLRAVSRDKIYRPAETTFTLEEVEELKTEVKNKTKAFDKTVNKARHSAIKVREKREKEEAKAKEPKETPKPEPEKEGPKEKAPKEEPKKKEPEAPPPSEVPKEDRDKALKTKVNNPDYGKKPGAPKKVTLRTVQKKDKNLFQRIWDGFFGKNAAQEITMIHTVTKLAHANPELRPALLPVIAEHAVLKLARSGSPLLLQLVKLGFVGPEQFTKMLQELKEGIQYWEESGATSEADAGKAILKQLEKTVDQAMGKINQPAKAKKVKVPAATKKRFLDEMGDKEVTLRGKKKPTKIRNLQRSDNPAAKLEFDRRWQQWKKKQEGQKKTAAFRSTGDLRADLIKIAYANPDLRPHLLPILKEAGPFTKKPKDFGDFKLKEVSKGEVGGKGEYVWTHKDDPKHQVVLKTRPSGKDRTTFDLEERLPSGRVKNLGGEARKNENFDSVLSEFVGKVQKTINLAEEDRGAWEHYIKKEEFPNPKYDANDPRTKKKVKFDSLPKEDQKKIRDRFERGIGRFASDAQAEKLVKRTMELVQAKKSADQIVESLTDEGFAPEQIKEVFKTFGDLKRKLLKGKVAVWVSPQQIEMQKIEQLEHKEDRAALREQLKEDIKATSNPIGKALLKLKLVGDTMADFLIDLPVHLESGVSKIVDKIKGKPTDGFDMDKLVNSPKGRGRIKLRTLRDKYPKEYEAYKKKHQKKA